MAKNLDINLATVNSALSRLDTNLGELRNIESLLIQTGSGWSSANASAVNEQLEAFKGSVDKIANSIQSIHNAVSQYNTNVETVDSSVTLNG